MAVLMEHVNAKHAGGNGCNQMPYEIACGTLPGLGRQEQRADGTAVDGEGGELREEAGALAIQAEAIGKKVKCQPACEGDADEPQERQGNAAAGELRRVLGQIGAGQVQHHKPDEAVAALGVQRDGKGDESPPQ